MPVGAVSIIAPLCHRLSARRPATILDLGCGFGLWGALVRSYLDDGVQPFATKLIGVEGWHPYRSPAWDLYSHANTCTITEFLELATQQYDAVLILDVIEHFPRAEGDRVLRLAWDRVAPGGELHVATPGRWIDQGAVHGNPLERHQSLWSPDDFRSLGFDLMLDGTPDQWGSSMILATRSKPA